MAHYDVHFLAESCLHPLRYVPDDGNQLARLAEVCKSYGLPVDVDALVRHIEGNVGMTKWMESENHQTHQLRHVGWLSPHGKFYHLPTIDSDEALVAEGFRPVFTHADWLDKVPNRDA